MASPAGTRKAIPKRLEEDMKNIPKFKPPTTVRKTVTDILGDQACQRAFDDILGSMGAGNNRKVTATSNNHMYKGEFVVDGTASTSNRAGGVDNGGDDGDFTTRLLIRLNDAEQETKSMRRQLVEKMSKLNALERENVDLHKLVSAPADYADEMQSLKEENRDLKAQILEMEDFLRDYGLVWVGRQQQSAESSAEEKKSFAAGVEFKAFAKKIDELNDMLSSEPAQVKVDGGGRRARLVHADEMFDCITVAFYRNGIMIRRGPFRERTGASYASFVRDIMDGYFPSEFQPEFPDGVMFKLTDKHESDYDPAGAGVGAGAGGTVEGAKMSGEEFLRRLPQTKIKNGEIVSIRGAIGALLEGGKAEGKQADQCISGGAGGDGCQAKGVGGKSQSTAVFTTPASIYLSSLERGENKGDVPNRSMATVQVRWIDGSTVVATMFADDCVGTLRLLLVSQLLTGGGTGSSNVFELRAAYPPRVLDDSLSMVDAGLMPNGVVHCRKVSG